MSTTKIPVVGTSLVFSIPHHNDRSYAAPAPWNEWDALAGCWVCRNCGAAAGYQRHNPTCKLS